MPASLRSERRGGFTLLEIMVALAVLAIVVSVFAASMKESVDLGKVATVDSELRSKAQGALARIVQDMRSTRSSSVDITGMGASPRSFFLYPIIGTTATSPYVTIAPTKTQYSWDPALTTGTGSWQLSTLLLTPYDRSPLTVPVASEVTDFRVAALGTTRTSGFSSTSPQTFLIQLQLSRRKIFAPTPANPQGTMSLTVTTQVTVQPG